MAYQERTLSFEVGKTLIFTKRDLMEDSFALALPTIVWQGWIGMATA